MPKSCLFKKKQVESDIQNEPNISIFNLRWQQGTLHAAKADFTKWQHWEVSVSHLRSVSHIKQWTWALTSFSDRPCCGMTSFLFEDREHKVKLAMAAKHSQVAYRQNEKRILKVKLDAFCPVPTTCNQTDRKKKGKEEVLWIERLNRSTASSCRDYCSTNKRKNNLQCTVWVGLQKHQAHSKRHTGSRQTFLTDKTFDHGTKNDNTLQFSSVILRRFQRASLKRANLKKQVLYYKETTHSSWITWFLYKYIETWKVGFVKKKIVFTKLTPQK